MTWSRLIITHGYGEGLILTCCHLISRFPAHTWWRTAARQRGEQLSLQKWWKHSSKARAGVWSCLGWSMDFQLRCSWARTQQSLGTDLPLLKPFGAAGLHHLCPQPARSRSLLYRCCVNTWGCPPTYFSWTSLWCQVLRESKPQRRGWKGKWCLW